MQLFEKKGFRDMAVNKQFFFFSVTSWSVKKGLGLDFYMLACPMLESWL